MILKINNVYIDKKSYELVKIISTNNQSIEYIYYGNNYFDNNFDCNFDYAFDFYLDFKVDFIKYFVPYLFKKCPNYLK